MTIDWTPDMIDTLRKMATGEPRASIQAIAARLGIDPSVVVRYCSRNGVPLRRATDRRTASINRVRRDR